MSTTVVENSILKTIKKLLGDSIDYYDNDVIIAINTSLNALTQLGVGPLEGFRITGETETWSDFTNDDIMLEQIKDYVYLRTRKIFDPPESSVLMQALNEEIKEIEFRAMVHVDPSDSVL